MNNAEELLPKRIELPFDVLLLLHWYYNNNNKNYIYEYYHFIFIIIVFVIKRQESLVKCTGITAGV